MAADKCKILIAVWINSSRNVKAHNTGNFLLLFSKIACARFFNLLLLVFDAY